MDTPPHVQDDAAQERTVARPGRVRAGLRSAVEPVPGVSRRTQLMACTVPLVVLPSALWRVPVAFEGGLAVGERAYVLFLSALSVALACTAFGLIARWGEVFPRWVPLLGGRGVPRLAAVVPATVGATILTFLWTVLGAFAEVRGTTVQGGELPDSFPTEAGGWEAVVYRVCYTPLILWGPLLAVLTVAYARRRRANHVAAQAS